MAVTPSTASYPADHPRYQPIGSVVIHYHGTDVITVCEGYTRAEHTVRPDVGDTIPPKIRVYPVKGAFD